LQGPFSCNLLSVFYQLIRNSMFELRANLSGSGSPISTNGILFLMGYIFSLLLGICTARQEESDSEDSKECFFHNVERLLIHRIILKMCVPFV